jgi:hypothetical protein
VKILILLCLTLFSCYDLSVTTHKLDCYDPGDVYCVSGEKYYCSMDHEVVRVCSIVSDCETECMHELVSVLVDDIQGNL